MDLGFIDDAIEWIAGIFGYEKDAQKKAPPPVKKVNYPEKPYDATNKPPDLYTIPDELAKFIVRWFVGAGMSLEGASAMAGNVWRESYMNPAQLQLNSQGSPKGPGRGLAQWTDSTLTKSPKDDGKGRWDVYQSEFFPKLKGYGDYWKSHKLDDLEPQLAFIVHELKDGYPGVWNALKTGGSLRSKAIMVLQKYEVARDRNELDEQNLRASLAEKIYGIAKQDKKLNQLITQKANASKEKNKG